jgi:hypothetical protein
MWVTARVEVPRLDKVEQASFDVSAFLLETFRSAQVAAVSPSHAPLLGSLWYLFDNHKFWFRSPKESPLARAAERGVELAVIVDDFNPPASIRQVRVRGHGCTEPHDSAVVCRIYERYLGLDVHDWPPLFRETTGVSEGWTLWSVSPDSGMAVTSPGFVEEVYRWDDPEQAPFR